MKKLFLLIAVLSFCFSANAQHTTPRFDGKNYSSMSLSSKTITDAASSTTDTSVIVPNSFTGYYDISVVDSAAIAVNAGSSWKNDMIYFNITATSGAARVVYFTSKLSKSVSNNWEVSSSGVKISVTAAKRATICFKFDGAKWVEQYRMVQ